MSETPAAKRRRARWRDPRIWIGVLVTAVTLWLALRGVSFSALGRDLARANLWIAVGVSVPCYLAIVYFRALRWRYLTDAIGEMPRGPLFRATAIGFMANNVFPLRIGEVVRAWQLSRETGAAGAAVFGTIILERAIDAVLVVGLALVVFGTQAQSGSALAVGVPLLIALSIPIGGVLLMRLAPDRAVALVRTLLGPLAPARITEAVEGLVSRVAEGLGSLQGGRHLFWVAFHSVLIWLGLGVLPFAAAIVSLDIELGSVSRTLEASYVVMAAVGIAVAIPSAPGFFGPYHLAARESLARFGVADETALAVGTLAHAIFWVTTTVLGLVVLRSRATRLDEIAEAVPPGAPDPPAADSSKDPATDRR